jgi:acyl-CoA hydrolase
VDATGRPIEVPDLLPETEDEWRRHSAAKERRRRRLEERVAEQALTSPQR